MTSLSPPINPETKKSNTLALLCNLPRMNPSASRLLAVSNNIDSALEEFGVIFSSDPSLAVELLRVANSAQFQLRATVSNLQYALLVLGIEGTRNLAFTIALNAYAHRGLAKSQIRPIWLHSLATAVIAEELGHCVAPGLPGLYTAGLTHEVGRLGLLRAKGPEYGETLGASFSSLDEANMVESVLCGVTHAEAGGYLAQTWGFPPTLCRAILTHHNCLTEDDGRLSRINQQACTLATLLGYPELPNCAAPEADQVLADECRKHPEMEPERLKALILRRSQEA